MAVYREKAHLGPIYEGHVQVIILWKSLVFLLLSPLPPIGMGCLRAHVLGAPRRVLPTICSRMGHPQVGAQAG